MWRNILSMEWELKLHKTGCITHMWVEFVVGSVASTPYVVEFVVGSLPCSERFFSRYSGFPLSSKTNISKFQFDQESGRRRTTLWMCYLQIIIYIYYLFIYWPTVRSRLLDIGPEGGAGTPIYKWWGSSLSHLGGVNWRYLLHLGCLDGKSLYLPIQASPRAAHKDI